MFASVWLLLSSLFYSLQLHSGSFPKPLSAEEERHYLSLSAQGDLEARNILVERNLRLVAHVMKNGGCTGRFPVADRGKPGACVRESDCENRLEGDA